MWCGPVALFGFGLVIVGGAVVPHATTTARSVLSESGVDDPAWYTERKEADRGRRMADVGAAARTAHPT